ncbi:MAG TPA: sensor domain-containing diguanylate cyclase [Candidatus Mailhella merdavium]|nr:sensor domain-containing diguanylate cyclase [Candidatus Mailhella merdavium]
MDMCMSTDAFPLEHLVEESEEPLWFWDILSDRLCLSLGVLNKLELSPQEAPADMKAYLRHLPPAEQDAVRHTLEEFLSSGEQLFRLLYFFDCRQVVAYAGVFRRDPGGRPIQIIGCLELAEQTPHIPFVGHAVAFLDKDLVCFDRNCAILLNREQAEPFTRSLGETVDLLHESERWQLRSLRRMYVPGSARDQFEENFMLLQNGGTYTRLNVNISVVQRDDRGRATMLAATLQSAFSSQSAAGSLLTLAVHGTGDGLWDWDATNDSVYYSPRYLSMLGYTTESFPPCLESWMKNIHPDDYEQTVPIQKAIVESPSSGNSFEVTYRMKKADNSWAWILGRGHVTHRDENGRATRLIGLHTDISAVQCDRERLEDMIKRDTLTGLYSRAFFEMMVKEHNCKPSWPISVISCDLNGLKLINDHLGHAAGDEVLTQGASLLRRCMRVSDCVARVGGDEFVALLPHCSAIQAQRIVADIQRNISICNTNTSRIPVYLSLGSSTSEGDRTLQETIHEADRIMLEQKVKTRVNSHHSIKRWIESHHHIEVSLTDSRNVGI